MAKLVIEKIKSNDFDGLQEFNCGNNTINDRMKDCYFESLIKQGQGYSIKFDGNIVGFGFYRITSIGNYSENYSSGHYNDVFCAIKLEYIGIDKEFQHKKIGSSALGYAIDFAMEKAEQLPIRYIAIEALPNVLEWYTNSGFLSYGDKNSQELQVVFMDLIHAEEVEEFCKDSL